MAKNFSTEDVRLISKSSLGLMGNLLHVHIGKLILAKNMWKIFSLVPSKKNSHHGKLRKLSMYVLTFQFLNDKIYSYTKKDICCIL